MWSGTGEGMGRLKRGWDPDESVNAKPTVFIYWPCYLNSPKKQMNHKETINLVLLFKNGGSNRFELDKLTTQLEK